MYDIEYKGQCAEIAEARVDVHLELDFDILLKCF